MISFFRKQWNLFSRTEETFDQTQNQLKKNELLQNDQKNADELYTLFKKTVSSLEINENPYIINQV